MFKNLKIKSLLILIMFRMIGELFYKRNPTTEEVIESMRKKYYNLKELSQRMNWKNTLNQSNIRKTCTNSTDQMSIHRQLEKIFNDVKEQNDIELKEALIVLLSNPSSENDEIKDLERKIMIMEYNILCETKKTIALQEYVKINFPEDSTIIIDN